MADFEPYIIFLFFNPGLPTTAIGFTLSPQVLDNCLKDVVETCTNVYTKSASDQ